MRIIHLADDIQPIRRRKRLSRQRTGRNKIAIKFRRLRRLTTFGSVNRGHSRILLFRQADPEIEFERPGKIFLPIIRQRFSSYAPHEFVEKKSKRARVIAMPSSWRPQRRLRFQRPNHSVVIDHVNALIQSAKPRLMRKQLPEHDLVFVCLPKLGPELRDGPVELNLLLLQGMQYTRAANSFRCRPDQHEPCRLSTVSRDPRRKIRRKDQSSGLPFCQTETAAPNSPNFSKFSSNSGFNR